jgi:hypothetical protein
MPIENVCIAEVERGASSFEVSPTRPTAITAVSLRLESRSLRCGDGLAREKVHALRTDFLRQFSFSRRTFETIEALNNLTVD